MYLLIVETIEWALDLSLAVDTSVSMNSRTKSVGTGLWEPQLKAQVYNAGDVGFKSHPGQKFSFMYLVDKHIKN